LYLKNSHIKNANEKQHLLQSQISKMVHVMPTARLGHPAVQPCQDKKGGTPFLSRPHKKKRYCKFFNPLASQ